MAVHILVKGSKNEVVGKFASIEDGKVNLFSGIMSDKKGGWRGCGRKQVFEAARVTVKADSPAKELRRK